MPLLSLQMLPLADAASFDLQMLAVQEVSDFGSPKLHRVLET